MNVDTDADSILAAHASGHHGVFRSQHARMAGLSRRQIGRRLAEHRWEPLYRDVYRVSGAPRTWPGDLLAACRAGGCRAVASHRSAAELHGLPGRRRDPLEVTCPRWRRAHHADLVVHETAALEAVDITLVDGIPVTSAARTLFDLGGVYRRGMVELAFESALRRGLTNEGDLGDLVRRLSRSGRPGGRILRELLAERGEGRRPTESGMETLLLQAIRSHGLPGPVPQFEIWQGAQLVGRVDAAYPDARIAIEYDSDEFHSGRTPTRRDRGATSSLLRAGSRSTSGHPTSARAEL